MGDEDCFSAETNDKQSKKKPPRGRMKENKKMREEYAAQSPPPLKGIPPAIDDEASVEEAVPHRNDQQHNSDKFNKNETNQRLPWTFQQEDQQHQPAEQPSGQYQTDQSSQQPSPRIEQSQDESPTLAPTKPPRSKPKSVNGLPWSDYNGHSGRYTGEVNAQYLPHGRGEMVYDRGEVSKGIWYDGVLDREDNGHGRGSRQNSSRTFINSEEKYISETLPYYSCGDKGRSEDMIIASKKETATAVALIRRNSAAWVRRSDSSWTYAIVKDHIYEDNSKVKAIRFKVNLRGSTKAFPASQWGTYVRRIKKRAPPDAPATMSSYDCRNQRSSTLGDFLDSKTAEARNKVGSSISIAGGNLQRVISGDVSVSSANSAPLVGNVSQKLNLTTGKMRVRTRSRSRSRNRKNITTLPLLFSSSMSVTEENEGNNNDDWETASGSGYRLRGIDP